MNDWMNERLPVAGDRARGHLASSCAESSPVNPLIQELRRAFVDGAPVGVVVDLVSRVYLLGSWGPQTVSWSDFLGDELLQMAGLSQDERVPFVRGLYRQGLSQRSIAPFLGVSHQTVKNDCARLGLSGRVIGANGKSYSPLPKWHLQTTSGHSAALGEQRKTSVLCSRDAA